MIDPTTMLILLAIIFGGFALVVVLIVYALRRITQQRSGEYYATLSVRAIAVFIDISVLRILSEIIWQFIDPSYYSTILQSFYMLLYVLYAGYVFLVLALGVLSYLVIYVPFFSILVPPWPALFAVLLGFFYFFSFEAFFKGRTLGRLLMKIETRPENQDRQITFREAYYNALGKTFLLVDIILGGLSSYRSGFNEKHQERYTQRLAHVVTADRTFQTTSETITEQETKPADFEEKDWWK
ncbi:MAG: RDD family protein [Candidatus Thorarchaeota archaeon]|jgi:uncharacterized RDD family membrane protein YckC